MRYSGVIAILFLVNLASVCQAQSVTNSLSVSVSISQSVVCDSSDCTSIETVAFSGQQSFDFPDLAVSRMGPATSVTVSLPGSFSAEGLVGDDPNYQVGDDSASIDNAVLSLFSRRYPCSMKVSWKNGQFIAKIKGQGSQEVPTGPIIISARDLSQAPGVTRALPAGHPSVVSSIQTVLRDGSGPILTSRAFYTVQETDSTKSSPLPDAGARSLRKVGLKSKYQVENPFAVSISAGR